MTPTKNSTLSEVALCRENGWGVGTVLVGDEGYGPTVIRITALGEEKVLARRISHAGVPADGREGTFVFWCRDWREVEPELQAAQRSGQWAAYGLDDGDDADPFA